MKSFFRDVYIQLESYYDWLVNITPKLLLAFIIMAGVWFLARSVRKTADTRLKKSMDDPLLAGFLANLLRLFILITGLLLALRILGFGGITTSILAGAGISAFVIGFALRDIGENFLAGILMAFKRPFRVGDFIETGNPPNTVKGRVVSLNIRVTQLKTPDGKDVYIPNANIIKTPLFNYTVDGFLRLDFTVSLPAGQDYSSIIAEMQGAVKMVDGVLTTNRSPGVRISGIASGRPEARVSFWIDTSTTTRKEESIKSDVILAVQRIVENYTIKQ
jgi:small-conductance mechanosensitive channel